MTDELITDFGGARVRIFFHGETIIAHKVRSPLKYIVLAKRLAGLVMMNGRKERKAIKK